MKRSVFRRIVSFCLLLLLLVSLTACGGSASSKEPVRILEGKTMHQVANFVSSKLSSLDGVTSTATHFIMKRYKDFGTVLGKAKEDYREKISI